MGGTPLRTMRYLGLLAGFAALTGCGGGNGSQGSTVTVGSATTARSRPHPGPTCPMSPDEREVRVPLQLTSPRVKTVETSVCVGGRGPFDFIVDTGSSQTLFTTQLARRLGLANRGPTEHFGGAGCFGSTHALRRPALSLGGHLVAGGAAYTIRATGLGGPGQPQGVLGVDSLSKVGPLRLDYRRRTLSIGTPATTPADPAASSGAGDLPADWVKHRPRIRAPLALIRRGSGITLRVIVSLGDGAPQAWVPDTGSPFSLIDAEDAQSLDLHHVPGTIAQPSSCSSKMLHSPRVWSRNWRLAERPLRPQALEVTAIKDTVGVEGVLGAKTMAEFGSVIFDWDARRLLLGGG